jgi:hypothetical protein
MKTTSYKISKQLLEAGFKAENDFWNSRPSAKNDFFWARWDTNSKFVLVHKTDTTPYMLNSYIPAYDLETILEALPKQHDFFSRGIGKYELRIWYHEGKAFVGYQNFDGFDKIMTFEQEQNESIADTAARLWLELKKKKII